MSDRDFSIILAVDSKWWVWKDGSMPWKLPTDLQYFRYITTQTEKQWKRNAVIMWRKTWDSLPNKFKPLDDRHNIVISRQKKLVHHNVSTMLGIEQALSFAWNRSDIDKIFIIGGANIYAQSIHHDKLQNIYLTRIEKDFDCDVFFLWMPEYFKLTQKTEQREENGIKFHYEIYERKLQ